jgi:phage shock protein C
MNQRRLTRSQSDRMIAGVAGGLAQYLGVDATLIRLAFVALALLGGHGLLVYFILWLVMRPE